MVRLLVEALFALVFAQALAAYLRRRDPVQRDVMAVFSAAAMLFVLDLVRQFLGEPPQMLRTAALILLFAQPYLTLRLVHRVHPGNRSLQVVAFVAFLVSVVPVVLSQHLSLPELLGILIIFVMGQTTAAVLLAREARARTGSPRARFGTAAVATALFGIGILAASAGTVDARLRDAGLTCGYTLCLVSALGYVVAFRPPAWIRRMWSGTASYRVSQQLLEAPAADGPERTWTRYARTVREVSGADAVLVVPPSAGGERAVVTAGLQAWTALAEEGDVSLLLQLPQTASLARHSERLPAFAVACAGEVGARFITTAPLRSALAGSGALVLLNRRRGLFTEDDVQLLAELGGQAALIAERGAVRAEQERLALELAQSVRALSAASQAKSDFLASMSHELRTPLNAIIGFSELMRGEESVGDARVVPADWIEHIYGSGRHLLDLINDILDLTKIEAGRLELHPDRVGLPELVTDAVSALRPLMERKSLDLRTDVPDLAVWCDPIRLRQVLDNLLANAIKFTPNGGRISVEATRADGEVRLTVADTGVGIDAADQQRIFEEFQQVGDPSMHHAGTGLGLALVRRLAEEHGGRVGLESTPGVGSRFTVCLPDILASGGGAGSTGVPVAAVVEPPAPAPSPAPAFASGGILLVEDDPSAARLLRTYLENAGYRVRVANTGEAGLHEARRERPEAMILDVLLPGIDGWDVLRELKQDDDGLQEVPVFVASVVDERDVGLSLGAADFFVKPIDRRHLLARIAEFLLETGSAAPGDVEPGSLEPRSLEPRSLEPRSLEPGNVEPRSLEPGSLEPGSLEPRSLEPETAERMRVLAVDDDPETLEALVRALGEQRVEVVTAGSGEEAVRLARARPFDLIISNLRMPDIDGFSLMGALTGDPATSRIPVLVITGSGPSETDRSGLHATRALGILPKGEGLIKALHDWMTRLPRLGADSNGNTGPEGTS